jgi:SepF-like predicted cell division protein (DUF552 family)
LSYYLIKIIETIKAMEVSLDWSVYILANESLLATPRPH